MDTDGEYPFYSKDELNIFLSCDLALNIWSAIDSYCPTLIDTDLSITK